MTISKKRAILLILVSALFYGLYLVAAKYMIQNGANPFSVAFCIALVLNVLIFAGLPFNKVELNIPELRLKKSLPLIITGLLAAGLGPILLYSGQRMTSATSSAFISQLAPIFTSFLGLWLIKEKLAKYFWVGLVLIIAGLYLLSAKTGISKINPGDILVLGMAFFFGLYNVVAKKFTSKIPPLTLANLRMFLGNSLVLIVVLAFFGGRAFSALIDYPGLIIVGSIFIYFYTYVVHIGIDIVGSSNTSALYTATALFSAIFAFLLLGEKLNTAQYIGGLTIISGIILIAKLGQASMNHDGISQVD